MRPSLVLAAAVLNTVGASASAEVLAPFWYSATVDAAQGTAHFTFAFNHAPDFLTRNERGQADAFGIWTTDSGTPPLIAAYAVSDGVLPVGSAAVISVADIPQTGELTYFWPRPGSLASVDGTRGGGGWGSVEGHGGYTIDAHDVLRFDVPLSIVDHDGDGRFTYIMEPVSYGDWLGESYEGVSNVIYDVPPVPEPSKAALTLAGLGMLGVVRYRMRWRQRITRTRHPG